MNEVQKGALRERVKEAGKVALKKKIKELPEILDNALESCLPKLIGMAKDNWDRGAWKIDHCNGRESLIGNLLKDKVEKEARDWAEKQTWPELTPAMVRAIKKEYRMELRRRIRRKLEEAANREAGEYVSKLIEESVLEFTKELVYKKGERCVL